MSLTGAAAGAAGRGQWCASGAGSMSCNPRKFSEKIALQIQRQAEDIAAFQEVMMDITSTRIQAQKVRQARSLASYYGGSLPNVSQMSACPTGNQSQFLSSPDYSITQQHHVRTEHGQRDHRPSTHGRSNRRHIDSAPYLSVHLSPPSGPSWRRNWFVRSANEKSQMDQTPMTALSRTRSDSALHTSVRMTCTRDPNLEQVLTGCSKNTGTLFSPPVPLIEENVQEEGRTPKLQKVASVSSGYDNPGNHISGSLPDLSILCLPSAAPEASNPPPPINTDSLSSSTLVHHLPSSAEQEDLNDTDFPLPSLSSCLQAIVGNPSFQSSLSNPNLQTTLSSPSLHDSLSSTSLCTSLSSSSLKSSLSSQSLRSSFSSSSLSNQSFQSTPSSCSYSSGIGGSCSSSSSSLCCSPRAGGQVMVSHTTSSSRRSQLSPLMVPSGEECIWQQPTLPPTLSSITQGVQLNSTKVRQEVKPPPYPYSQFPLTGTPKVHNSSQSWQLHQSAGLDQCRQNTRWCQEQGSKLLSSQCKPHAHYMHHQSAHCQTQESPLSPYHCTPQQQLDKQMPHTLQQYQQSQSNQQQQQINCAQPQQYLKEQAQQFPPQHQQQYPQIDQCWSQHLQLINHNQNQLQYQSKDESPQNQPPLHNPSVLPAQDEYTWNNPLHQLNFPNMRVQRSSGTCMQLKERPKLQSKKLVQETEREKAHSSKAVYSQKALQFSKMASPSSPDNEFRLHNKSYTGLHLTPSQTEALSQKLGQLHKVTRNSDSKCQDVEGKHLCEGEHFRNSPSQSYSDDVACIFPSISCAVPSASNQSATLDDVISDLPFSIAEFDLDPFILAE